MKIIVAEVLEELPPADVFTYDSKPAGTTWYPDGRVIVKKRDGTPPWLRRMCTCCPVEVQA